MMNIEKNRKHAWTIHTMLLFVIFTSLVSSSRAACGINFEKMRKRRVEAIKGQILSKLGLSQLPSSTAPPPSAMTRELESMYNRTRDFVLEQARTKRVGCDEHDESYFAQDVVTVYANPAKSNTFIHHISFKGYEATRLRREMSEFFHFNFDNYNLDPNNIVSANLRLYQVKVPGAATGERQQVQLYQLSPPQQEGTPPIKQFLDMRLMDTNSQGWSSFDVTSSVREWLQSPKLNQGLELTVPCTDDEYGNLKSASETKELNIKFAGSSMVRKPRMPSRGDHQRDDLKIPEFPPEYDPHLVIMVRVPAGQSTSHPGNSHRRRKRALDADYCFRKNPTETNCCLRELFIDFRKDLGWNWIHAPSGYKANFCGGDCPYLWNMDSHYSTLLSLYKSMNPHASSAPCCTAKELEPLTIMYHNEGKYKITQMSDMVLLSCTCR